MGPYETVVERLFANLLQRQGDAEGLEYYGQAIERTTYVTECRNAVVSVARNIVYSDEATTALLARNGDAIIAALYGGMLDRSPDSDGQQFWLSMLNDAGDVLSGVDRVVVRLGLTAEFQSAVAPACSAKIEPAVVTSVNGNSDATIDGFVENAYAALFSREPDTSGYEFFTGRIDGTSTSAACEVELVQTVRSMIYSDESAAVLLGQSTSLRVDALYRALLARSSDASGNSFWSSLANNQPTSLAGTDRVVLGIADTDEFKTRAGLICGHKSGPPVTAPPSAPPPPAPQPTPVDTETTHLPVGEPALEPFVGSIDRVVVGEEAVQVIGSGSYGAREALLEIRVTNNATVSRTVLIWTKYASFATTVRDLPAGNYDICVVAFRSADRDGRASLGCVSRAVSVVVGPVQPERTRPSPPIPGPCDGVCTRASNAFAYRAPADGAGECSSSSDQLLARRSASYGFVPVGGEQLISEYPAANGNLLVRFKQLGFTHIETWRVCRAGWYWDAYTYFGPAHIIYNCTFRRSQYLAPGLVLSACTPTGLRPGH